MPHFSSIYRFTDPLTTEDREELRWYLEDYLQFPFGAERWRAEQLEIKMKAWGTDLFRQIFPKTEADPDPRSFYQEAVREGFRYCEFCIVSDDPAFLNLPWELIHDPTPGRGYLASLLHGLYRKRKQTPIRAPMVASTDSPFRILLVLARPYGPRDIPLGTVARPLLDAIRPLRPKIELELLRPPSFDALQKRLNDRPGHYHLVHFDGHGAFAGTPAGPMRRFGAVEGQGLLAFEREDGSAHLVSAADLGQALADSHVPLFVLNACQSAQEGSQDPFSSVAAQLTALGPQGVVAMSYSVYADSASRFMERFYETLVGRKSLGEAIAAARQRLFADPHHPTLIGELELKDWMVPILYQQAPGYVPISLGSFAAVSTGDKVEVEDLLERAQVVCPEGRFGFIGRDFDLLRLERALREPNRPWVMLTGVGGIGKTELAYGFGRWYAETGGCPGGVFAATFKEKASFGQVIGSIAGYGTRFSRLPEKEQERELIRHLQENACLLIWDNFETVSGYPSEKEALATPEEREKLTRFLKALRGGKSRVLITTRQPTERWLDISAKQVELDGLNVEDAGRMSRLILEIVGLSPEWYRDDPEYGNLVRYLKGHPRSQELVLPRLKRQSPVQVLEALRLCVEGGETMEDVSIAYAFEGLTERERQNLPFLVGHLA